jgi:hypothetical protein
MCRGIVEHVGENLPFARGNVVLLQHDSSAGPATDNFKLVAEYCSWVRATPLSAEANEYTPISVYVTSLS